MPPSCAICELPLLKQERFVLIGSETAHRECAMQGRSTRGQRLQVELAESEHRVARRVVALEARREEVARLTERVAVERAAKEATAKALLAAEQQRREALAECDRLRAMMAEMVAPRPDLGQIAQVAQADERPQDEQDASVARFSLLELD